MDSESPNAPIDKDESLEAVEPIEVAEVVENTEVAESVEPVEVAQYADPAEGTQESQKYEPVISHQLPPQFQNVAAKGGAVAALVLGVLAVFGAFITQWWELFCAVSAFSCVLPFHLCSSRQPLRWVYSEHYDLRCGWLGDRWQVVQRVSVLSKIASFALHRSLGTFA